MWATFVIPKKLLKENNHPLGENSSNLVTLPPKRTITAIHSLVPLQCIS
jgi:hypothetical protein